MTIKPPGLRGLITPEQIQRVRESKTKIQEVKGSLKMLQKLGVDVKVLEDKIQWTEEVQDILLEEFDKA